MDLDLLPRDTSKAVVAAAATPNVGHTAVSAAVLGAAPAVVALGAAPAVVGLGAGSSRKSNANALRRPPPLKRTTSKPKSHLAAVGAPSAPTTLNTSSFAGGLRLLKSMGFTSKSTAGSANRSQQDSQSLPPHDESVNDSQPIQGDDDEDEAEEEDVDFGTKRKLTSIVWKDFKKVKICGKVKAQCLHCHKRLGGKSSNGTRHLHDHLKICTLKKIKMAGQNKTLAQSSLRFNSQEGGKISVEKYTFDPQIARRELAAMIVLHEYPLSIVDHIGFQRFVTALQPLFKMVTRNTIRKDIMDYYMEENKKALAYMAGTKSRVAITTDLWTSDNQKRGYMAVTAHFIDDSWTLRSIIMRFIYVPAPHTTEVICEQLYEALVEWNLDEKISTLTLDNCTTNDKVSEMKIKSKRNPRWRSFQKRSKNRLKSESATIRIGRVRVGQGCRLSRFRQCDSVHVVGLS